MASAGSSLKLGATTGLASENSGGSLQFKVSVYPVLAGYSGTYDADFKPPGELSTDPFFDPIRAYRFWNVSKDKTLGTLTQSGNIIGDAQGTPGPLIRAEHWLKLWEKSDPNGIAFSSPPDHTENTVFANLVEASGSIDITGITKGSIYIIYGAYRSTPKLSMSMRGSGKAGDIIIEDAHNGDIANNNELYIARVDFVNEDAYKTVDWALPKGANYRLSGIIVTSPDPSR
jgi:hypothetical protein